MLQQISHTTRAYIVNAKGLVGFLKRSPDIIELLSQASLKDIAKWQVIKLSKLEKELKNFSLIQEKLAYLKQFYSCLYIFILKSMNRTTEVQKYMLECNKRIGDYTKYTLYIHGNWLPWIAE